MALVFIDGFDHYSDIRDKYDSVNSFNQPTFVAGRFGGLAMRRQDQNFQHQIDKDIGSQTEIYIGFAFNRDGGTALDMFSILDTGGTARAAIGITANGAIQLSAGGQVVTSADNVITIAQYAYVEARYVPKSVGGIFECRVDEVVVATINGDTTTGADDDIRSIRIGITGGNFENHLMDDLYVLNTTGATNISYLGDSRIQTLRPIANGNTNDFTPTPTSTNFEAMDETQLDDDVTFVEAGQLNAAEDYANAAIGLAPGPIFGVQATNASKKTDAGTIKYKDEMVIGGVRFTNGIENIPGSGGYFCTEFIRDTDPSDDATWTEAKVNAVGSGFTITFREI